MIDYGIKGKVALITGANNPQGIGAATAFAFAQQGAKVVLVYKREPRDYDDTKTASTAPIGISRRMPAVRMWWQQNCRRWGWSTWFWRVTFPMKSR